MLFQFYISSVALVLQFFFILVSSRLIYFQLYGTAESGKVIHLQRLPEPGN